MMMMIAAGMQGDQFDDEGCGESIGDFLRRKGGWRRRGTASTAMAGRARALRRFSRGGCGGLVRRG